MVTIFAITLQISNEKMEDSTAVFPLLSNFNVFFSLKIR